MHFKKANWVQAWKSYQSSAQKPQKPVIISEASPAFVSGVNRWIDVVTDGGDYPLNDVLPWDDLFDGALRMVIPAASEDDENLAKIVLALRRAGWHPPGPDEEFPVKTVMQKKRRLGTGEVYEEETEVVKLDISRTKVKVIPKGPRAGEEVRSEETTTISRAINKATKNDKDSPQHIPAELAEWWQKKQTYYTQPQNAEKIEKLFTGAIEDSTTSNQAIVLSRHPIDVLRMGDVETTENIVGDKIGHCHREGGEYARCAQQEALGHGPIAYLVDTKDLDYWMSGESPEQRQRNHLKGYAPHLDISDFDNTEIFSDRDRDIKGIKVINRVRLRQFRDNETNEMWAVPEKQVYPGGSAVPGFLSAVRNWSWDKQKEMYEEAYDEGKFPAFDSFERLGGKYADTRDGILLNAFFSQSGVDPDYPNDWVRYEDEDADELEPSAEELAERMDDRVQEIMETMNERMEHASVHGEVDIYDEDPVCLMSGNMGVSFNEDLFGEDGGAEWELPSGWREQSEIAEAISSALSGSPHYIYINTEDMQIDEYGNMVTFSFYINNEDYENNADGFDRFADHVESEYDSNYDAIRRVIKRILIREGYMGRDAYENLHKQLEDSEENEDTLYRHWDFDIDGNEITFQLKDPASLVDGPPNLSGLYLGTIPAGTSLTYLFHDWHYEKSKEFDNLLIPTIRQLFDDAEKAALRQLSLPGVEAKEMHGLLLPSRAQFRLKQVYDSYSAPAHIYLQIKMEIDEDITEEQIEEIRYFLEYLDAESQIDIIQKAAVEIFEVFRIKAVEQKKIEERATRLATNLIPILNGLSILQLTRFAADIDPDMGTDHSHIDTLIERIHNHLELLLPGWMRAGLQSRMDDATRALSAKLNLKKVQDGLAAVKESQASAAEAGVAWVDREDHSEEDWELLQYGAAGKILGISLSKAATSRPENTLVGLAGSLEGIVATVVGRIKDVVHRAIKDPASSRTVRNVTRAFQPDPMPEWYKQQLEKANLSANQILSALPPSALAGPRSKGDDEAIDALAGLLPESLFLMERIDATLIEWDERADWPDTVKGIQPARDKLTQSYTDPGGVNREIYIKALADKDHPYGKFPGDLEAATQHYDDTILPRIQQAAQETPIVKSYRKIPQHYGAAAAMGPKTAGTFYNQTPAIKPFPGDPSKARPRTTRGEISLSPGDDQATTKHELIHALSYQTPTGLQISQATGPGSQESLMNQALPPCYPVSAGEVIPHHCDSEERYADIKKFHTDEGYFTGEKIQDIRDGIYNTKDKWSYPDLQKALGEKWEGMTDQEIADILNKIAARKPKAKRGEPTQAVAESLSILNRIDAKLNEQGGKITPGGKQGKYAQLGGKPLTPREANVWMGNYGLPSHQPEVEAVEQGITAGEIPSREKIRSLPDHHPSAQRWAHEQGVDLRRTKEGLPQIPDEVYRSGRMPRPEAPQQFSQERERWKQAYTDGANKEVWMDKIGRENPNFSEPEKEKYYKQNILPAVTDILQNTRVKGSGDRLKGFPEPGSHRVSARGHDVTHEPGTGAFIPPEERGRGHIVLSQDDSDDAGVFGHEMAHVLDPGEEEDHYKKLPGSTGAEAEALLTKVIGDPEANLYRPGKRGHHQRTWEVYASLLNARVHMGRKFTPKDINILRKGGPELKPLLKKMGGRGSLDLRQSFNPELADEEVADILNQVAVRQPKAKRQQPDRMVAEDIVHRISTILNEGASQDGPHVVQTRDEIIELVRENPHQRIFLDSPRGSYKAFGRGEDNKVQLPFDYGEFPDIINPADSMGWDLIIVPSATQESDLLIPVGHVEYSKERQDKLGNDKIILAPRGRYNEEDQFIIDDFFAQLESFEPVRWH